MTVRDEIIDLKHRVAKDIVGQEKIVEALLIGMLSNGNLLVEGLPGLAKTRAIKALASNIEGSFNRIQFTPDLVSGDIIGREVYYKAADNARGGAEGMFKFEQGPIFANIVLADEVNRAPPRSQNALLEAMEERQVTIGGASHKVPDLFMVMATMNPAGQGGTFPMPEAQMDRFLMHVSVDYPKEEAEIEVIRLIRKEVSQKNKHMGMKKEKPVLTSQQTIFDARAEIDVVTVPAAIEKYIVDLIYATRYPQRYSYELKSFIRVGASPRGSLAIDRCCRTNAWLQGRTEVNLQDVHDTVTGALRHRLIRGDRAVEHKFTTDQIIQDVLEAVALPDGSKYKPPKTAHATALSHATT